MVRAQYCVHRRVDDHMLTLGEGYNALRAMRMGRHERFCAIRIGDGGATDRSSHLHHIEIVLAVFTSCGER